MSNEGFDPCEIIWGQWNHELSMRRLLNVLRNSQSHCTDTECFSTGPVESNQLNPDQFLFLTIALISALFLYYFRPRAQGNQGNFKPDYFDRNSGGSPPSPPPSSTE